MRVLLMDSSPKACVNICTVSVKLFPNLKQNLTQTRCSFKTSIFTHSKYRKQVHTRLHSKRRGVVITHHTRSTVSLHERGNSPLQSAASRFTMCAGNRALFRKFRYFPDSPRIVIRTFGLS